MRAQEQAFMAASDCGHTEVVAELNEYARFGMPELQTGRWKAAREAEAQKTDREINPALSEATG